jgi:hypothetical protein
MLKRGSRRSPRFLSSLRPTSILPMPSSHAAPPPPVLPRFRRMLRGARSSCLVSIAGLLALGGGLVGCAKKPPRTPDLPQTAAVRTPKDAGSGEKTGEGRLPGSVIAQLGEGTIGPYAATNEDGSAGLLVLVAPEGAAKVLRAAPLDARGVPTTPLRTVGKVPSGLASFSLRAVGSGYLAVWTRTTERGHIVETAAFLADGSVASQNVVVESLEPALWADLAPVAGGAHVYLAAPKGEDARISAVFVNEAGKPEGASVVVAETARAWQVVSLGKTRTTSQASALAMIEPASQPADGTDGGSGKKDKQADGKSATPRARGGLSSTADGTAVVVLLPAQGQPLAPKRVVVSADGVAAPDLDAVNIGDRLVMAYTDHSARDGRVHIAAVSANGALEKPRPVVVSAADQAMLALVAPANLHGPLLLVWEDSAMGGPAGRRTLLTSVGHDLGHVLATSSLDLGTTDESVPLFVGDGDGFAGLFLSRACLSSAKSCASAKVMPTVTRLGADLRPTLLSPFFPAATGGAVPDLAWGLACSSSAGSCFVLSADDAGTVSSTRLEGGDDRYRSPLTSLAVGRGDKPRLVAAESISEGPSLADGGLAKVGNGYLLATLTNHAEGGPAPTLPTDVDARSEIAKDARFGKTAPRSAIVSVRPLDESAQPTGVAAGSRTAPGTTLTVRGLTAGGVAIAAGSTGKDAAVAWVARDGGDPEVFVTRVGSDGKKQKQALLTHAKGEVGDVGIVPAGDGWLVVWIDTRDGNGEIYSAKIDHDLRKQGQETRLTNAVGDATEISVFAREGDALLAFSDTRAAEKEALGDPYVLRVSLTDGKKIGEEVRLANATTHAHGVRIVPRPQSHDLVVVWHEQPHPADGTAPGSGSAGGDTSTPISFVRIDGQGSPKGMAEAIELHGNPTISSFTMNCDQPVCRFVGARADRGTGRSAVFAGTWDGRGNRSPARDPEGTTDSAAADAGVAFRDVAFLRAGPGSDPVPMLTTSGGELLVLDDGSAPGDQGRVKRLTIEW